MADTEAQPAAAEATDTGADLGENPTQEAEEYPHPSGSLASNPDEDTSGENVEDTPGDAALEAATGHPPDGKIPGAVPSTVGSEQAPEQQIAQQGPPPEWMQQIQQQAAYQQQMQQQMFQAYQQQQQFMQNLFEQSAAQKAQQALEASRPRPPAEGAPLEEWFKYQKSEIDWHRNQDRQETNKVITDLRGALDQAVSELKQREALAQRQAQASYVQQQMAQMARTPGLQWVAPPDQAQASSRQVVVKTINDALRAAGHNHTLPETAKMLADAFGLNGPTVADRSTAQRTQATAALKTQRAQVAGRQGPLPGSAAGKAGKTTGNKRAIMEKYQKLGVKYSPAMKALYDH